MTAMHAEVKLQQLGDIVSPVRYEMCASLTLPRNMCRGTIGFSIH